MLTAATGYLADVGSTKSAQDAARATPPAEVDPAAADVVSMLIAQFAAARDMFVKSFAINAGPRVATEPSDASAAA
jgi:hypothetical protein